MTVTLDLHSFDRSKIFSDQDVDDLNMATIEKTLNVIGYIPVLRDFSGIVRAGIGVFSLIHDVAQLIFHARSQKESNLLKGEVRRDFITITHDVANICRAVTESYVVSIPLIIFFRPTVGMLAYIRVSLLVISIVYDIAGFRLKYPGEVKASSFYHQMKAK